MMKMTMFRTLTVLASCWLGASSLQAQRPNEKEIADLAVMHSDAMKANREVLKNYSNNYRVEVSKDNELQWIDLVNVQIGPDQNPILTQVNRDKMTPQEKGLFGRKGRKQQEAAEEMDGIISYAMRWITYYNRLPADRVFTLFRQAARDGTYKTASSSTDIVGVWSTNVRDSNANDEVNIWFNKLNGHPVRTAFTLPVEKGLDGATGETISAVINYRYLRNGEAFYPDTIDVSIPSRGLKIRVEHLISKMKE